MSAAPKSDRALREEAVDWFLKRRDRPDDAGLDAGFGLWLAADERHARAYEHVRCLMGDAGALLASDRDFLHRAGRRRVSARAGGAVAVVGGAVLLGGLHLADIPLRLRADYRSATAERRSVTAPDGSTVTLNADSAIALRFSEKERRVVLLRGEIFVEVTPDAGRPFTVEAGPGTATALGTAFDVGMGEAGTSVTVLEHSVLVRTAGEGASRLEENQRVDYAPDGRLGAVETVDPASVAAWRRGRFIFENKPLAEVVEAFERYLPGRVVIARRSLGQKRLSGNFDLSDPRGALSGLAAAFDIRLARLGPYVTVLY